MKKEISPVALIAAVVVVVLLLGIVAFKKFGGDPAAVTATEEQKKQVAGMRTKLTAPGVHRDPSTGHFVDAQGNPVDTSMSTSGQH